jgi:hypothetical protein
MNWPPIDGVKKSVKCGPAPSAQDEALAGMFSGAARRRSTAELTRSTVDEQAVVNS